MVGGEEKGQNCCCRFGVISASSENSHHCDFIRSLLKKG